MNSFRVVYAKVECELLILAQGNRWKCTGKGKHDWRDLRRWRTDWRSDIRRREEGQPPDVPPVAGPPVRGPPCVALASEQCRANPRRESQYTPVPDTYRRGASARRRRLRLLIEPLPPDCRLDASAETARGRPPKKRGHGHRSLRLLTSPATLRRRALASSQPS